MSEKKITLILDRNMGKLWLEENGVLIGSIWNVTGLKRVDDPPVERVRILRKGHQIGNLWEVEEIKEQW